MTKLVSLVGEVSDPLLQSHPRALCNLQMTDLTDQWAQ